MIKLDTKVTNTWCPGCTNFAITATFRSTINDLIATKKYKKDDFVMTAGIGCHGKIADYVDINSYTSLHGRELASAEGIKIANPNLTVIAFAGDGDAYAEGIEHLIHAAKRNTNVSLFVHNNEVFGLTTGQATPTSPKGTKSKSTPFGSPEEPLNPLFVLLSAGATFVARSYALDIVGLKEIMKKAILHKGFAIVDIIQPCISFKDTRDFYKDKIYKLDSNWPTDDIIKAMKKVQENSEKVATGIFYDIKKSAFEDNI